MKNVLARVTAEKLGEDYAHTARNYRNHYKTKTATVDSIDHSDPIS
jgi:hypothetical protein